MTLATVLTDYINACFIGLWVQTLEPDEAEREITRHALEQRWKLAVWDVANGIRLPAANGQPGLETGAGDPLAALRAVPALAEPDGTALLLLHNFHRFVNNPEVIQTAFGQLVTGKQQRTFLVVLAPVVQIPVELEKLFVIVEHTLPDRGQLQQIARELTSDDPGGWPDDPDRQRILDAAAGLTRYEAEGSFALSLARHGSIRADVVWELKAQALKKNNLLSLYRGKESFADLGGLAALKDFCGRALQPGRRVKARGVLLLGPPGTGKSAFAKALGNETGRPALLLDLGALYGSLVGQTEANIRQALRIADAMSPCLVYCDEIEKALSGVGSQGDSGVATRLFGTLLSWMNDHESDVFLIATCNDVAKLPPEFSRAERFDALYFLDLPTSVEKDTIWNLYAERFAIPEDQTRPEDADWTGAEVRACCRLAALLDMPLTQAARHVVPVAVTAAEQVEKLRSWASGRCLSAASPGVYTRAGGVPFKAGRRVHRGASQN